MMEKFQIAVATLPKSRLDIHLDIDMIKVALIYGDEVKLYSLSAEFSTYTQIIIYKVGLSPENEYLKIAHFIGRKRE